MLTKKICILGSFAVGKTSLVQRYVKGIFSEKYLTTLGVKIDKKTILINDLSIDFIIWDLAGEDEFMKVRDSYLKGTAAYLLVVDGTRSETLETAFELQKKMQCIEDSLPFVMLVNKSDLKQQWTIDQSQLDDLRRSGWQIMETSAKSDEGVDESFQILASAIVTSKKAKFGIN